MNSLTNAKVMDDTAGLLGFIDAHDKASPARSAASATA